MFHTFRLSLIFFLTLSCFTETLLASEPNAYFEKFPSHTYFGIAVYYEKQISEQELKKIIPANWKLYRHLKHVKMFEFHSPKPTEDESIAKSSCAKIQSKFAVRCISVVNLVASSNCSSQVNSSTDILENYVQTFIDHPNRCPLLSDRVEETYADGNLTLSWAQEYIGADLAKEVVTREADGRKVDVAIFDANYDLRATPFTEKNHDPNSINTYADRTTHGSLVLNLMSGRHEYSASQSGEFVLIHTTGRNTDHSDGVDRILAKDLHPKVVNISMDYRGSEQAQSIAKLKETNVVTAAANLFPYPVESAKTETDNTIVVASLSPLGLPSWMSQDSEYVAVGAPSDVFVTSVGVEKNNCFKPPCPAGQLVPQKFRATSGATPQVSGSLINVAAIMPELTRAQRALILQNSALKTPSARTEVKRDGNGMVNALKMAEVAALIQKKCQNLGSEAHKLCIDKAIVDPKTYVFDVDSQQLEGLSEKAKSLFPSCRGEQAVANDSGADCTEKKTVVNQLRRIALLTENKKAWEMLSCAHINQGFKLNARFYETMSKGDNWSEGIRKAYESGQMNNVDVYRNAKMLQGLGFDLRAKFQAGIQSDELFENRQAIENIFLLKDQSWALAELAKAAKDEIVKIRFSAIIGAEFMGEKGIPILKELMQDSNKVVVEDAGEALQRVNARLKN